jgi:hypothetical protein
MPSLSSERLETASSPYINRFLQPDTLIPYPLNPQSFNRYSYVINNPIRYSDPSGHMLTCGELGACGGSSNSGSPSNDGNDDDDDDETLENDDIIDLLDLDIDEFFDWKEQNPELFDLLHYAKKGNIIVINWNGITFHLMIVEESNGGLGLYDTDNQYLLNGTTAISDFTSGSVTQIHGAELLSNNGKGGSLYSPISSAHKFGDVWTTNYDLSVGWNVDSQGPGGVLWSVRPDIVHFLGSVGGLSPILAVGTSPVGAPILALIGYGGIMLDADQVPVYVDNLPHH